MKPQNLIFTNHVAQTIDQIVDSLNPPQVFVLTDTNTAHFVLPRLEAMSKAFGSAEIVTVPAGDMNKTLDAVTGIWDTLAGRGCRRGALLINLGGGVITDMGAFVASTFKRGIPFINVPTTLLGAVDAAVGGKTGINFNGLKNQIGLFNNADVVIISTTFFNTLPATELRSGYAEMIKHGLIDGADTYHKLLRHSSVDTLDPDTLLDLLRESVAVKQRYVEQDPEDNGVRHALNLGHTFAHAFESLAMKRTSPMPHGYAVAQGLVCALILSHIMFKFPTDEIDRLAAYVRKVYGIFEFDCSNYDELIGYMAQDKKLKDDEQFNFTLLKAPGEVVTDCHPTRDDIVATLDIYLDKMSGIDA